MFFEGGAHFRPSSKTRILPPQTIAHERTRKIKESALPHAVNQFGIRRRNGTLSTHLGNPDLS